MSPSKITPTNVDNRLKMPEAGYAGWREHTFFEGWNKDGTVRTSEGWKNLHNDQEHIPPEGWNGEPPYATGGLLNTHTSDRYRERYDQIRWNK